MSSLMSRQQDGDHLQDDFLLFLTQDYVVLKQEWGAGLGERCSILWFLLSSYGRVPNTIVEAHRPPWTGGPFSLYLSSRPQSYRIHPKF